MSLPLLTSPLVTGTSDLLPFACVKNHAYIMIKLFAGTPIPSLCGEKRERGDFIIIITRPPTTDAHHAKHNAVTSKRDDPGGSRVFCNCNCASTVSARRWRREQRQPWHFRGVVSNSPQRAASPTANRSMQFILIRSSRDWRRC